MSDQYGDDDRRRSQDGRSGDRRDDRGSQRRGAPRRDDRGRDRRDAPRSAGDDRPRRDGDRPSYGGDRRRDGDRRDAPRSYGSDRPRRDGDRPSYSDDRRRDGDRPSYGGDRRRDGDRRDAPRSYGSDRPRRDGDRPSYGGDRRRDGDRPSYSSDRGASRPRRDDCGGGHAPRGGGDGPRGGSRLTPKSPRKPEPAIREGVTGHELDRGVKNQLRTLSKENADGVAQHLVMVAELLDVDLEGALAHAETAARRAGRVPAAREALGLVAYRMGDWARALGEFRTVRRLSGSSHLLPLMVDCERGLGRHAKALELAQTPEAQNLAVDDRVELAIVVSGIRRDLGQLAAAAAGLSDLVRRVNPNRPLAARLYYAYADALLAAGEADTAREWFARAADADHDLTTDAAERLEELDGVDLTDLLGDEDDDDDFSDVEDEPDRGEQPGRD